MIEERLEGREASLIAICDGRDALALPIARDHKRLGDGDTGPNTGGMGAYSPLPDLPDAAADALVDAFHRPILAELARRGTPFRGALYAGLMLTADGPVLLECNARFGDPETQAILPRLAAPLGPLLLAAARGSLAAARGALGLEGDRLPALPGATVAIVLAAAGYPDAPRRDDAIARPGRGRGRAARWCSTRARPDPPGRLPDRRRARAGRGRTGGGPGRRGGHRGERPPTRSTSMARSAATTSPRTGGRRGRSRPMIRRYTLPEMGAIWTEEARFEAMLRVELAVAAPRPPAA